MGNAEYMGSSIVIAMMKGSLLLLTVVISCDCQNSDRVVFSQQDKVCRTVSGPGAGKPCVLPFVWGGSVREGCIKDGDPDNKYWCSTKVDREGNHIPNSDNWAHCSPECTTVQSSPGSSSSVQSSSSAFTVEKFLCFTAGGREGTCQIPSTCIGATIDFIENNECRFVNGEEGVCCLPISVDNIINIIDSPDQRVDIPNSISVDQADDIFLRFGGNTFEPKLSGGFASDDPAPDVVVDTNFIDDTAPTELHLRFNTPRNDIVKFDKASQIFLKATQVIKSENNLTDIQASIGL